MFIDCRFSRKSNETKKTILRLRSKILDTVLLVMQGNSVNETGSQNIYIFPWINAWVTISK